MIEQRGVLGRKYDASFVVVQYGKFGGCYISIYGFYLGENNFGIIFGYLGKFSLRTVGQSNVHVDRIIFLKDP